MGIVDRRGAIWPSGHSGRAETVGPGWAYAPTMPLYEAVRLALSQIRAQKLKSFFTLLGVTIGVMFLIAIVSIKLLCRIANVASVDAGAKGAVIGFRGDSFAKPSALVEWITSQGRLAKLRPDMKLVIMRNWDNAPERLKGVRQIMTNLVKLAGK